MRFWLRYIIFTVIIIGLAVAAYLNMDLLLSYIEDTPAEQVASSSDKKADSASTEATKTKKKAKKKQPYTKNAAAEGLSRFYASINPDDKGKGPKIRNGVVFLPDPTDNLEKFMEARRMVTRPLPKKWKGTKQSYAYRKGETLYQKLSEYAKQDKLEVIWRLNRDLLVKDPFRINKDIFKMSYQVGQALSGRFAGGVFTYFCYKHRAIVLIEYANKYLDKQCILLKK
jgi:toxin co-regulated pilus biosynthesis protein Q